MVQRVKQTAKKPSPRTEVVPPVRTAAGGGTADARPSAGKATGQDRSRPALKQAARPLDRANAIEQERDDLKVALEVALARIQTLEAAQTQVANRIGWMIEALQTLRDEGR